MLHLKDMGIIMFQLYGLYYMGGCQNHGPFLGPLRHLLFRVPEKGTLILATTHMDQGIESIGSRV